MKKWQICTIIYIFVIICFTIYCQPNYLEIFEMLFSSIDYALFSYYIVFFIKILEWTGSLQVLMKLSHGIFAYVPFLNTFVFVIASFLNIVIGTLLKVYYYISLFITMFTSVHSALLSKKICERYLQE